VTLLKEIPIKLTLDHLKMDGFLIFRHFFFGLPPLPLFLLKSPVTECKFREREILLYQTPLFLSVPYHHESVECNGFITCFQELQHPVAREGVPQNKREKESGCSPQSTLRAGRSS
jgi:hypothetical protein